MPTPLTPALLNQYFKDNKKHVAYEEVNKIYSALRIHANGEMPAELIQRRRPNEPPEILAYREQLYEAVTKETFSRIITCLQKIRRSADWSIRFPEKISAKIAKDETPQEYFDKRYPAFTSLTNWLFSVCLKNYLIDANAVCTVIPLDTNPQEKNIYLRPFPFIFNSDQVYEYQENDYCVIESKDKASYLLSDGKTWNRDGKIFWVITYLVVQKWEQVNSKGDMVAKIDFTHNLGYMPAFKLGGVFLRSIDATYIYESRIQPIVPRLNKAAREDNDLDVTIVRHLFLEKWEYASFDCPKCVQHTGKMLDGSVCGTCKGVGKVVGSPFQSHLIKPAGIDEQAIPVPPAGYIGKDIGIVQHAQERIEAHTFHALAAVNLEFLAKVPLSESGIAKAYDRDEGSNTVHSVAEDLVSITDKIIAISYDYRYTVTVPDTEDRKDMLPEINVPERFDFSTIGQLMEEYKLAKDSNMNAIIVSKMEAELVSKRFSTDPGMKDELLTILRLDPFSGKSSDDKMTDSQNSFVTKEDSVISSNIVQFVRRAVFEDPKFYSLPIDQQQEKMVEYAKEKMDEMSAAAKVVQMQMGIVGEEEQQEEENTDDANSARAANQ